MAAAPSSEKRIELTYSASFGPWLREHGIALGVTTYQTSMLFVLGTTADGRIVGGASRFERVMGACLAGDRLWLSTRGGIELLRREPLDAAWRGYDAVYVPRQSWFTGQLDAHDIAEVERGALLVVATRLNAIVELAGDGACSVVWKPPFVSRIVPEDRCHLNGLALKAGKPAFATAVSRSDVVDAWRDRRVDGGVVIDVETGEVVAAGLSMPHSPRWHREQLYVLNAGSGELGVVDPASGRFTPIAFCPGFLRGLVLHGDYALVGMSKPREELAFRDLPLGAHLDGVDAAARCGVHVIDLRTGGVAAWVRFEGRTSELFDTIVFPSARPIALAPNAPEALEFRSLR